MRYHVLLISVVVAVVVLIGGCGSHSPAPSRHLASSVAGSSSAMVRPAQEPGELWGDMDTDLQASVGDAIKILRIVVALDTNRVIADANRSGSTDVGDAIKVLRCVVGLDDWPIGHYGGGGSVDVNDGIAADKPTSPQSEEPGDAAVTLLEAWEGAPPEDTTEFGNMLTQFTNIVDTNPDSSAGQLGLSLALIGAGAQNAADDLGYDLFDGVGVQSVASLALSDKYSASRTINKAVDIALFRPWQRQKTGVSPQGQIPDTYYTTEEIQQIVRANILPVLNDAIARLDILSQAPAGTVLITLRLVRNSS